MSKLITTRFEYAIYDDASGSLTTTPPVYPTVIDNYQVDTVASTGQSYGSLTAGLTSSSATQTLQIPAGATLTLSAPQTNTTNVCVKSLSNVALTPGGTAAALAWTVQPGQFVTLPAAWNTIANNLAVGAVDTTNAATSATWSLQVMWSL